MKKSFWVFFAVVVVWISVPETVCAYDAHHPNPMSILNGRHVKPRKVKPRRPVKVPIVKHKKTSKSRIQKWRMYRAHKEGKYIIKPEPFSLAKKEADPELLGPQRTYQKTDSSAINPSNPATAKAETPSMTRNDCIGLIGQEKFDHYLEKYGGEQGALHRCLVLKRLQGS